MSNNKKNIIIKYVIITICVALAITLDILEKSYCDGKVFALIPGIVGIVGTVHNYGAGFSILQNATVFFVVLASIFIAGFIFYEIYSKSKQKHLCYYIGISLILAGTIGNAIDRVCLGYVRDSINLEFMSFPVFNLADAFLTIGVIIFAVYLLFFSNTQNRNKKNLKE